MRDRLLAKTLGLYAPPGHYYSPTTSSDDAERTIARGPLPLHGVNLNEQGQRDLAATLAPTWRMPQLGRRYRPGNDMYGVPDAAILSSMLRHLQPKRIIEVGSGWSTAVMLDTRDRWVPDLTVTCIEPYTDRLRGALLADDDVTIIEQPVQAVDPAVYDDLRSGDVLFIDSTHVVKAGSDVHWLILHVLPRLAPGVHVHVHDVFWPFEYPDVWLRERRDWTEAYLLHAFLLHNETWRVRLFSSWLWDRYPEVRIDGPWPSGLWLQRRA